MWVHSIGTSFPFTLKKITLETRTDSAYTVCIIIESVMAIVKFKNT